MEDRMGRTLLSVALILSLAAAAAAQTNPALLRPANLNEQAPATFKAEFQLGNRGTFVIEVNRVWDPSGADRFYNLVKNGFYDGNRFYRVIRGFVAQVGLNGNPRVTSAWRNSQFKDEPVRQGNRRGFVSFAKPAAPNARTTQFFINLADNSALDQDGFSAFGRVISGMDVVDRIYSGDRDRPVAARIQSEGNAYLVSEFPKLDFIQKATIVP
jgi:peptidyl-prolyl cis-trans isomerase A (cyclophilin A)